MTVVLINNSDLSVYSAPLWGVIAGAAVLLLLAGLVGWYFGEQHAVQHAINDFYREHYNRGQQ